MMTGFGAKAGARAPAKAFSGRASSAVARGAAALKAAAPVRRAAGRAYAAAAAPRAEMVREWPNPEFIAATKAAFPEKGIATVDEGRVLYETGYTYLDVRSALELDEVGKVKNSVNIPLYNAKWVYDAEKRERNVAKSKNEQFLEMVKKRFPKTDTPLMIACSDGRTYSIEALEALDGAGYTNLVGLRGGYIAWFKIFDNKLNRRYFGEYAETYKHDGDSCGIHASGAGFENLNKEDQWVPRKF